MKIGRERLYGLLEMDEAKREEEIGKIVSESETYETQFVANENKLKRLGETSVVNADKIKQLESDNSILRNRIRTLTDAYKVNEGDDKKKKESEMSLEERWYQ